MVLPEQPVRTKDVMKGLGVSERTIRRYTEKGMPSHKIEGLLFFYWSEINDWIGKDGHGNQEKE